MTDTAALDTAPGAVPTLTAAPALPADRNPAVVYLASLAHGPGRQSMGSSLIQVAAMLGCPDAASCPWHDLRHHHVAALRAALAERYAPASANKALSAVRGVLRAAWRLGIMDTEDYQRAIDVPNVKGSRLPAGRALDAGELRALFEACADGTVGGARDAAAFALMFGCGLRRAEAVAVQLADYSPSDGAIRIIGKGNRERTVYATNGGQAALDAWLATRGDAPGAMLARVSQTGAIDIQPMTAQSLMMRLRKRAKQAGIGACSPHDLRRSFVSAALEGGADIAMVQRLAGHASPTTTARYDRRPEHAAAQAARVVHVPFRPAGSDR